MVFTFHYSLNQLDETGGQNTLKATRSTAALVPSTADAPKNTSGGPIEKKVAPARIRSFSAHSPNV
jgi:hypothetical protein